MSLADKDDNDRQANIQSGDMNGERSVTHHDKGLLIRDMNARSPSRTSELNIEALERADVGYRYLLGEWVDT